MADVKKLAPNPGFVFTPGAERSGGVWVSELIALTDNLADRVAVAQTDSTATTVSDLKDDFNALLAKLRAAGLMET